ncbi:MAG: hypothetical protein ACLGIV_03300 [Actinomycetes bacterium]
MSRSLLTLVGSQAKVAAVAAAALALGAGGALAATAPSGFEALSSHVAEEDEPTDDLLPEEDADLVVDEEEGSEEEGSEDVEGGTEEGDGESTEESEDAEGEELAEGDAVVAEAPDCPEGVTNHGQYVSGVARDTEPGPGHGATVSEAARTGCVLPEGTEETEELEGEESEGEELTDGDAVVAEAPECPEGVTNHGQYVSGVARDTEPGPGHGATVSAAARTGCVLPEGTEEEPEELEGEEELEGDATVEEDAEESVTTTKAKADREKPAKAKVKGKSGKGSPAGGGKGKPRG